MVDPAGYRAAAWAAWKAARAAAEESALAVGGVAALAEVWLRRWVISSSLELKRRPQKSLQVPYVCLSRGRPTVNRLFWPRRSLVGPENAGNQTTVRRK